MMLALSGGTSSSAEQITAELIRCRQRGLDRLDVNDQRQKPVIAPKLESLASSYAAEQLSAPADRAGQIRILLSEALDDYAASENEEDASLIRGLFLGDRGGKGRRSAGTLLKTTRDRLGEPSESAFRERFKIAFVAFAEFLTRFVGNAVDLPDETWPGADRIPDPASALPVTTDLAGRRPGRFIELLANATEATIIGFDNELLVESLEGALRLKRIREDDPRAFWSSLDIIFLRESLLDYLDDHAISPDQQVAVRERRRAMTRTRRQVRLLLRQTGSTAWSVADSLFLPPFSGSLFVLAGPSGPRHVVQLIIRQPAPRTRSADQLYLEFDDLQSEYFTKAFRRVVDRSIGDNRPVPVGNYSGATFVCTETVYRAEVLEESSGSQNWLPMVLVVTTQRKRGEVAPVLQLRTDENAIREIGMISHLARHIYQDEQSTLPGAHSISAPPSFDISSECATRAAQLRVQIETGDDRPPNLLELTTGGYVNPNTDNLFFFVYSSEFPENIRLPRESEMRRFALQDLLKIRGHQALRIASDLFKLAERPSRFWRTAVELATLNLALHGYSDLGLRLSQLTDSPTYAVARAVAEVDGLIESTTPTSASSGGERKILGLSGYQYREFFSVLLPQYAKVGVPGAREELRRASSEPVKPLLRRVASLYQDEDLLGELPIQL